MAILQIGIAKSGNFWLYKIIQGIIKHSALEQRSFIKDHPIYQLATTWQLPTVHHADIDTLNIEPYGCFHIIWPIFREPVENIDEYVCRCSHVWTHSPFNTNSLTILPKFDKIVYIIRDPRDVAVSMSKFVFTPYIMKHCPHSYRDPDDYLARELESLTRKWVQHVGAYLQHKDDLHIYVVFYERLLHSFHTEILDLLAYLNIELEEDSIAFVKREVGFANMKKQNPNHVRKGKSGQWARVLTDGQKRQVVKVAGPMLRLLNYPVDEAIESGKQLRESLPSLPADMDSNQLRKALTLCKGLSLRRYIRRSYEFAASPKPVVEKLKQIYVFLAG